MDLHFTGEPPAEEDPEYARAVGPLPVRLRRRLPGNRCLSSAGLAKAPAVVEREP